METWSAGPTSYLSFIEESNSPFTLKTNNTSKNWDGTLYYSIDTENWTEWDGTEISSSNDGKLYLNGKNNTKITGGVTYNEEKSFVLTSDKRIKCQGNIESLLDYKTVEQGNHPVMADCCYSFMFSHCDSLTGAPELPATTLTSHCYHDMFAFAPLTQAPKLPATTLAEHCYRGMFYFCRSLSQAPALPATTLAEDCYGFMFWSTSLTQAPALPATTLAKSCYYGMFAFAPLTQAPKLPATTLAEDCYFWMFYGCNSLTGQIHCASNTSSNSYRLTANDISGSATIVFDL